MRSSGWAGPGGEVEDMRRHLRLAAALTTGALLAACTATSAEPGGQEQIALRWATSDVGSYGYAVASFMVDVLDAELEGNYVVTVHPYPSASAAMKAVMDGDAEFAYTADVGMQESYVRSGPFEGYEPGMAELVHTFYAYPMESFLLTSRDNADQYATYADFDGEAVFFTPSGSMNWLNFKRVFEALGYEFNHVEMDSSAVADALESGSIVGAGGFTTAG